MKLVALEGNHVLLIQEKKDEINAEINVKGSVVSYHKFSSEDMLIKHIKRHIKEGAKIIIVVR